MTMNEVIVRCETAGNIDVEKKEENDSFDLLMELDKFSFLYPSYPATIYNIYRVYSDMLLKQEYFDVTILDGGSHWGYIMIGKLNGGKKKRHVVPICVDDDIDLEKLHDLVQKCTQSNVDVFVAIYSSENIIYQSVTDEAP